jgi:uncharacterized iron-regulated membrane protein
MPWSMVWGAQVQRWATAAHLYEPPAPAAVMPAWQMTATMPAMSHRPHADDPQPEKPWAMEKRLAPGSLDAPGVAPIGIDRAAAIFRRLGVNPAASFDLPDGPKGAYVANWRPDKVEDTRVVYLDQYTGSVLGNVGFADWGPAAKAIEWGIAVHQGQEYGPLNRWVMLAGCVAILLLATSAATMWWKRRPRGSLGIPPLPAQPGAARGLIAIVAVVGVIYPLVGATLVVAALVDLALSRIRGGLATRPA